MSEKWYYEVDEKPPNLRTAFKCKDCKYGIKRKHPTGPVIEYCELYSCFLPAYQVCDSFE